MLNIQKFLRDRKFCIAVHQQDRAKLSELASEPLFLKVNKHGQFANLVQFSYSQIDSPKDHPIVREARGLILDQNEDWKVVAYPFNRFFNFGEPIADTIDWKTARVQEKVDGSLIIMYWYADRWRVATRGTPDASGQVGDHIMMEKGQYVPMTFSRLFWQIFNRQNLQEKNFDPNLTYLFELTSDYNHVVCSYDTGASML